MDTVLIVLAVVVAYLAIGALIARAVVAPLYRRRLADNMREFSGSPNLAERWAAQEAQIQAYVVALGWPLVLPGGLVAAAVVRGGRRYARFMMAPVAAERDRRAQLEADATKWRRAATYGEMDGRRLSRSERDMANELADSLWAQAEGRAKR
jgi:hypothetical protein